MKSGPDIARIGALIGDPARANILAALMAGRALSAGECALETGVTASTASGHLAQLVESRLLVVEAQGRHRYYRIADPDIAEAIEAVMGFAERIGLSRVRPGPCDPALRRARYCYDHLAGEMAAAFYAKLVDNKLIKVTGDGIGVTDKGRDRFIASGIDIAALEHYVRPLCRSCLDWSERRPHLAGGLGAAIASLAVKRGWCRREQGSRIVIFAPGGIAALLSIAGQSEQGEGSPSDRVVRCSALI